MQYTKERSDRLRAFHVANFPPFRLLLIEKNQSQSLVSSFISTICFELIEPPNGYYFLQSLTVVNFICSSFNVTLLISAALSFCFHRLQVSIIYRGFIPILVLDDCSHRNFCWFDIFFFEIAFCCSFFNSAFKYLIMRQYAAFSFWFYLYRGFILFRCLIIVPSNGDFLRSLAVILSAIRSMFFNLNGFPVSISYSHLVFTVFRSVLISGYIPVLIFDSCVHRKSCWLTFFSNCCSFSETGLNCSISYSSRILPEKLLISIIRIYMRNLVYRSVKWILCDASFHNCFPRKLLFFPSFPNFIVCFSPLNS